MAAITLTGSKLQIRMQVGTLSSGKAQIQSLTLDGLGSDASAGKLLAVSNALGGLVTTPVVEVLRVDTSAVEE